MNKPLRYAGIAFWIGMIAPGNLAWAGASHSEARLTVCVRNYADVPAGIMMAAERVAQRIFGRADVGTTWIHVILPRENAAFNQVTVFSCDASGQPGVF